ncbi:hypothetical protein [Spiroplasma endosymbiont of Amphimallon solstitiale]|uniref:hypothetical protein n=1 Tax=Spiroplasma endosymbiont of Amphimallon solstitiale TaxID=3066288 RepID=UPI00313DD84A
MQEQISIENQFSFYEKKSNDVFKRALEYLKVEYEDKETFHSKSRKSKINNIFGDFNL